MDHLVEIPAVVLLDLVELSDRAADDLAVMGTSPQLVDALRGAIGHTRSVAHFLAPV